MSIRDDAPVKCIYLLPQPFYRLIIISINPTNPHRINIVRAFASFDIIYRALTLRHHQFVLRHPRLLGKVIQGIAHIPLLHLGAMYHGGGAVSFSRDLSSVPLKWFVSSRLRSRPATLRSRIIQVVLAYFIKAMLLCAHCYILQAFY